MHTTHPIFLLFPLLVLVLMALGAILIMFLKLSDRNRPKPARMERLLFWLTGLGIFAFLSGMALMFLSEFAGLGLKLWGAALTGGGFLVLGGATHFHASAEKRKRQAWPVVAARCTQQQLEVRKYAGDEGSTWDGWLWRLVCEISYDGKQFTISPKAHWSAFGDADAPFGSEKKARQFIAGKISPNGECQVRVNPANPSEAELV